MVGDSQAVEARKDDSLEKSSANMDDELFREIWERESQPELSFEVAAVGKVIQTQDLSGRRWAVRNFSNTVWEAAIWMHHFFQDERCFPAGWLRGRRILELGAGTGLVGLSLALLGAEVTMTDLEEALPILRHNTDATFGCAGTSSRNGGTIDGDGGDHVSGEPWERPRSMLSAGAVQRPNIQKLSWGNVEEAFAVARAGARAGRVDCLAKWNGFDIIVGADVIYNEATFPAILCTLSDNHLCSDSTLVYLATRLRGGRHRAFLDQLAEEFHVRNLANPGHAGDLRARFDSGEDWREEEGDHYQEGRQRDESDASSRKACCRCTSATDVERGADCCSCREMECTRACRRNCEKAEDTGEPGKEDWSYDKDGDMGTMLAFAARRRRSCAGTSVNC